MTATKGIGNRPEKERKRMAEASGGKPFYLMARKGNAQAVQDYLNEKAQEGYRLTLLNPVYAKTAGQAADIEFWIVMELREPR
jgi:hypothetical protein